MGDVCVLGPGLLLVPQLRGIIITSHLTDLFGLPELLPQTCSTCLAAAYYSAQAPTRWPFMYIHVCV